MLMTDAQMSLVNTHSGVSSKVGGLNFGLSLHLHPYLMLVSSDGSGKSVYMRVCICTDSPKPSLLADVQCTKILITGPLIVYR